MMKIYFSLLLFILLSSLATTNQPYFPSQITFSPDNNQTIFAIDEINQRAYKRMTFNPSLSDISFVMKNFSFAIPDSPESKYYVQLFIDSLAAKCMYGTYWKYGGNNFNTFPSHWWFNESSFEIKNYLEFKYEMLYSNSSSIDEDYWYSNVTCRVDSGETIPCEEIYFKKNTQIPLRFVQVVHRGGDVQETTNYQVISMGKPDEKFFDSIPIYWSIACRDVSLRLSYYPQSTKINLNQSSEIHISLPAPPHRIHGNDTVSIQWEETQCNDCVTWTPKQLSFNSDNFQEKQILTITRIKDGPETTLIPICYGGGFDFVSREIDRIHIQ